MGQPWGRVRELANGVGALGAGVPQALGGLGWVGGRVCARRWLSRACCPAAVTPVCPLLQRGGDPSRAQLLHQLGQEDVLCQAPDAG